MDETQEQMDETQEEWVDATEEEITGLLIEVIQNYPWLYNLQHPDYKNNNKKLESWTEIADLLHLSVEEVQKKWKSIRDKYTREKREKTASGSGLPEIKWEHFEKMAMFYEKCTKPRKTYSTTKKSETKQTTSRPTSGCSNKDSDPKPSGSRPSSVCSTLPSSPWNSMDQFVLSPTSLKMSDDGEVTVMSAVSEKSDGKTSKKSAAKKSLAIDENLLTVAKEISENFKKKTPIANANRTCVEYIYACLEEMSPEEAKLHRKKLLETFYD